MRIIIFLFAATLYSSCGDSEEPGPITGCVAFDERQCDGNDWLTDDVDVTDIVQKINALRLYLDNMSIGTVSISADPNYHEAVCEACFICPEGTRYFMEIDTSFGRAIGQLNLLNLQQVPCN